MKKLSPNVISAKAIADAVTVLSGASDGVLASYLTANGHMRVTSIGVNKLREAFQKDAARVQKLFARRIARGTAE